MSDSAAIEARRRNRQCGLGWHEECSDRFGESCECECHPWILRNDLDDMRAALRADGFEIYRPDECIEAVISPFDYGKSSESPLTLYGPHGGRYHQAAEGSDAVGRFRLVPVGGDS